MVQIATNHDQPQSERHEELLESIVSRYANEIAGVFDPKAYEFAKGFTTTLFARLLNASQGKSIRNFFSCHYQYDDDESWTNVFVRYCHKSKSICR
jgi:N-acetyl-gamma-glutamylphosphate reductase